MAQIIARLTVASLALAFTVGGCTATAPSPPPAALPPASSVSAPVVPPETISAGETALLKKGIYLLPRAEQIPRWRRLATAPIVGVQLEALQLLARIADPELVPLAIARLADRDHRSRAVGARAIARAGLRAGDAARSALVKAFTEADRDDRPAIAWALVAINAKAMWREVVEVQRSGHLATVERLGGGRAFDIEALSAMATPDEWASLAADPNDAVRQMVAGALSRIGEPKHTAVLVALVDHPNIEVAREAVSGLAIAAVRVRDVPQDWALRRLGSQLNYIDLDSGPRSMTRVVLRARLLYAARKGDGEAKRVAIATLELMKEQGALMALRDEKGDTGDLGRKALFEIMNPVPVPPERLRGEPQPP